MSIREHVSVGDLRASSARRRPEHFLYKAAPPVAEAWMRRTEDGRRSQVKRPPRYAGAPSPGILGRIKDALIGNSGLHPASNDHYAVTQRRSVNRQATKYHGFCKVGGCTYTASRFPAAQGKFKHNDPVGPLHQAMAAHLASTHKIGAAPQAMPNTSAPAATVSAKWNPTPVKTNKPMTGKPPGAAAAAPAQTAGVKVATTKPTVAPASPKPPAAPAAPPAMKTPVGVRKKVTP